MISAVLAIYKLRPIQPNCVRRFHAVAGALVRRIAANQQHSLRRQRVAQRSRALAISRQRLRKRNIVRSPVVVDIVGRQYRPRELLQQVSLFIGQAVAANDANALAAARIAQFSELLADVGREPLPS